MTESCNMAKWGNRNQRPAHYDLKTLYELYSERVRSAAFFVLRDNHAAEDIMQETFITAFEKLSQVREPEKIEAWLVRVAINKAKNSLRSKPRQVSLSGDIPISAHLDDALMHKDEITLACEAVARLPAEYQVVLYFKCVRGLTPKQIADALEIPEGTVKSRLQRARETAKEYYFRKEGLS